MVPLVFSHFFTLRLRLAICKIFSKCKMFSSENVLQKRKIFSVVCLLYGKYAIKLFSVFGFACKNLFPSIQPPNYHQPPHNQLTWKNHKQNQNTLISKSKSKPIYQTHHPWNPQITQATNPPKPTPNRPPSTLELNLTHHHWNP